MGWFGWVIVALVGWGLWGLLSGLAARGTPPLVAFSVAVIVEAVVGLVLLCGSTTVSMSMLTASSWWAAAAGVAGAVAYAAMYKGLEHGPTGTVVAVSSLYPAVTVVLAVPVLGEGLTVRKIGGVGLAVVAAWLLGGEA